MKYICHKRYRKTGASGKEYNIRYGTEFSTVGAFIADGPEAICAVGSEDAHRHFARNDDGMGLQRGQLTYRIAYADRRPNKNNGFRFTPEEIEMLETEFPHFLRDDVDTILFNHDFFNADVRDLQELIRRLEA